MDPLFVIWSVMLFLLGMFSGWMIAPYFDKIAEWRNKRIKKEAKKEVNQCLA